MVARGTAEAQNGSGRVAWERGAGLGAYGGPFGPLALVRCDARGREKFRTETGLGGRRAFGRVERPVGAAVVYVNTLMIQDVLAEPAWADRLTAEDKRGLNPLFTSNMTPYGEVKLNMTSRLDLSDPTPPPPETEALAA